MHPLAHTGGNSPSHNQTTYDYPPFGSSGDACVEITQDIYSRQTENGFRNGAAPVVIMRQSEGLRARTRFALWSLQRGPLTSREFTNCIVVSR